MTDAAPDRRFRVGEEILLIDRKKRRYLVTLEEGGEFHTHSGFLHHADIVGQAEGAVVRSSRGATFTTFRPTLSDFVLKMPRGAQVIYPKDLGPILMLADIFPGARVLESGVGSGALSMTMLRAGAVITGYELRADFAARAQKNVAAFGGTELTERYRVEERDCYEGIDEENLDRVVLDLPEPWQVVGHAEKALHVGRRTGAQHRCTGSLPAHAAAYRDAGRLVVADAGGAAGRAARRIADRHRPDTLVTR